MFGIGTGELMLIAAAGLLVFGVKRLPDIGASMGRGFRNFRKALDGREESEKKQTPSDDISEAKASSPRVKTKT